ncbi:hypothetical protein T12_2073 [Trichinella patagoniensis]|uniref:Uncharacterized protein n=1 Tax=Trichinella patagoniensis TaxID=990121 RepID=A0A0V0Z6F4_9BILA|nr:hypothetical protein T12_2073 [Trichinella patagoniensis]
MPYVGQATKCLAPLVGPVPLICDHSVQMALAMRFPGSVVRILWYGIPLVIFSPYPGCQRIIQHTPRLDLVLNSALRCVPQQVRCPMARTNFSPAGYGAVL